MAKLYSQGAQGNDVKELQAALNYHIRPPAKPLDPDGIFGPLTAERVRQFQSKANLAVDGIVGPNTISFLYKRIVGVSEIVLTPVGPVLPRPQSRHTLLPATGLPIGGLPLGPVRAHAAPPAPAQAPKPKKSQTKYPKSTGFDVKSQLVLDPLADGKKSPKIQYKITLTQDIPWPLLLPKPAKLSFDVQSSPLTSEYSMSGKLKVPFYDLKLPPIGLYKSGTLSPYFFTGAGIKQHGFGKLNAGVGAALKIKLIEFPHRPYLPTVSLSADGGYKYDIKLDEQKIEGKGFFQGTVGLEWRIF